MPQTQTRLHTRSATINRKIVEIKQPQDAKLLTAEHAQTFLSVVVDELMGDPTRIPATIKRKQLFADMMLLFHLHVTGKGMSSVDIGRAAHVELLVVKSMLTPLVDLDLIQWEYRRNHATRNGSGRVRHYAFSDRLVEQTLEIAERLDAVDRRANC
jgi:hypothetical protein